MAHVIRFNTESKKNDDLYDDHKAKLIPHSPREDEVAEALINEGIIAHRTAPFSKDEKIASKKKSYSYDDYTVGWICALIEEQTVAKAMLDETHPGLPNAVNDSNSYILGSIGHHNVVIACMPTGDMVKSSAANVAALMLRTFTSIRFGLMVGVGGGVPPKVRLGDVVVSTPVDQYPGVVQWDLNKTTEGGTVQKTGALNRPPQLLLTALNVLKIKHEEEGSQILKFLEDIKTRNKELESYTKSDSLKDVLFKADHVHHACIEPPNDEGYEYDSEDENRDSCEGCDKSKIVKRSKRSMRVHYGLIASGNNVIDDGLYRGTLNSSLGGGVLCFEMEAAGLMKNFPCLVIRGICDYCDSHKNNAWRKYASAVAAAYTKELLQCIEPSGIQNE
ncbi:nucleoside phosphorylase domain-containing protein [Trichoderma chlorosporum]